MNAHSSLAYSLAYKSAETWFIDINLFVSAWTRNLAPVLDSLVHLIQEEDSVSFFFFFFNFLS